ncbi:hypothetical protein DM860_017377 [Cuscuta australis]|uniref:Uncharacterized protein n=1 Tax=Cuscuta australis TaxID=267555 RepID=A0A328DU43_9ASTE|nr:hypothetical protein DM860_017377 [Cuscuta australis]
MGLERRYLHGGDLSRRVSWRNPRKPAIHPLDWELTRTVFSSEGDGVKENIGKHGGLDTGFSYSPTRFKIEAKFYRFEKSKCGRVQICEEVRRKSYRFWTSYDVLQWICNCLDGIIFNPTASLRSEEHSEGNKRYCLYLDANSSGFYIRIQELRIDGFTSIVIPEGSNKSGIRLFVAKLRQIGSSIRDSYSDLGQLSDSILSTKPQMEIQTEEKDLEGVAKRIIDSKRMAIETNSPEYKANFARAAKDGSSKAANQVSNTPNEKSVVPNSNILIGNKFQALEDSILLQNEEEKELPRSKQHDNSGTKTRSSKIIHEEGFLSYSTDPATGKSIPMVSSKSYHGRYVLLGHTGELRKDGKRARTALLT